MESSVNLYLSKPFTSINKVIVGIWMPIGLFLTASTGLAQDGSDVTFEADTVIVEQDNNIMVARGNVRVTHEDELLEAQSLEYNHLTGTAIAMGEVKLKTNDGAEYRADKMFLDNNFKFALASPLISLLSNESKFSLKKNSERKRKRTVFDSSAFSPCNCDFDKVQSPIWDLKATSSEQNPVTQTITHYNVGLKIFGLPKSSYSVLALRNPKDENKINDDKKTSSKIIANTIANEENTKTTELSTKIQAETQQKKVEDTFTSDSEKIADADIASKSDYTTSKSDITFEADSITVEQENNVMSANGNVRVMQQGDMLEADLITYNQLTGIAKATGGVRIKTRDGIEHLAEEMVLDENFTHAVATPLVSTLADGSRFSSRQGEYYKQKRTVFDRSVFSPCNCDYDEGESPIWDLRATKSEHNTKTQTIIHSNVRMNIFGLPVFYFPVLSHPDDTVKRHSGLLSPMLRVSNDIGLILTTPFYQVMSPTQDIEFQPTSFQRRGQGFKTIYRQRWDEAVLDANIYGARLETFKEKRENVGAIDVSFSSNIGSGWRLSSLLQRSSQDTFLRRYGYNSNETLTSSVTATKITNNRFYQATMSDLQGLRETDTPDKEPTILPSIFYAKTTKGPLKDQIVRQELSALHLDNDEGYDVVRWTALLGTEKKMDIGSHILTTSGDILASYHDVQKSSLATDELSTFGQGNLILSGDWEYPIGVQYGRNLSEDVIITPRLKATVISGSDRTDELPNRDASDFRLDEANLFLNNRFQGRDFILPGTHVAGGISGITSNSTIGDLTGFAGLSLKAQGKTPAGLTISGREDYSDYIASFAMNTPFNLNLFWSGRADYDELNLNESHTSLDFTTANTSIDVEHTQMAQGFFEAAEDDKEEAQVKLSHKLRNDIRLIAEQVWDLSSGETKQDQSAISAEWSGGFQNCVTLSLGYKRDAYVDRDIKKVSQLQLLLSFKYLGSVDSSGLQ